jgi:hypothetical protein
VAAALLNATALNDRRFRRVVRGNDKPALLLFASADRRGQDAVDAAHLTAEREFAHDRKIVEVRRDDLLVHREDTDSDWQIEARAFLLHIGRREVNRCAAHDVLEPAVLDGSFNAVARFLHRRVRQANDDNGRLSPARINFNLDRIRINAENCRGMNLGEY